MQFWGMAFALRSQQTFTFDPGPPKSYQLVQINTIVAFTVQFLILKVLEVDE